MTLCKTDIERSFTRAAGTYDASVQFQKQCAEEFCEWLAEHIVRCPETILEAGCGTGLLTERLHARFPSARLLATDLSSGMVRFCAERFAGTPVQFQVHDFDQPFPITGIDLAAASLSLQWSRDLRTAFENISEALRPDGEFFAAIPLDTSLAGLRGLFRQAGTPFRGPVLPSRSFIEHSLDGLFRDLSCEIRHYTETYPDFRTLLRSMSRNGTSGGNTGTPIPVLKELIRNHRTPCSAEYEVVFLKGVRA